jgi:hypothetical protein
MSRKMVLRLACGASVFLLCVAVRVSWSDDDDAFESQSPRRTTTQPTALGATPTPNAGELRQRMVELMGKRAQRMSPEELTRAIDELTKTLADQDSAADAELQKASEQLNSVVVKFPGTPAAASASRAIEAIQRPTEIHPRRGPAISLDDDDESVSFDVRRKIAPPTNKKTPVRPVSK